MGSDPTKPATAAAAGLPYDPYAHLANAAVGAAARQATQKASTWKESALKNIQYYSSQAAVNYPKTVAIASVIFGYFGLMNGSFPFLAIAALGIGGIAINPTMYLKAFTFYLKESELSLNFAEKAQFLEKIEKDTNPITPSTLCTHSWEAINSYAAEYPKATLITTAAFLALAIIKSSFMFLGLAAAGSTLCFQQRIPLFRALAEFLQTQIPPETKNGN
jgi:hypothetical protein